MCILQWWRGLTNEAKIKSIGPCIQDIEAKTRLNLVVLSLTQILNFCRLPSISPQVNETEISNLVYQLCGGFEVKNH